MDVTGNGNDATVMGNVQQTDGVRNETNGAYAFSGYVLFEGFPAFS